MDSLKERIINAYACGSQEEIILTSFNITHEDFKKTLLEYKEESKFKKTFTDDFKKVIAERDINGIARSTIAGELELNIGTVKKCCELFGQAFKERASSENEYTKIEGKFSMNECPECKSHSVNLVEENAIYCMECGNEFEVYEEYILKVNFEYLDE